MIIIIQETTILTFTTSRIILERILVPIFQQVRSLHLGSKATGPSIRPISTISCRG